MTKISKIPAHSRKGTKGVRKHTREVQDKKVPHSIPVHTNNESVEGFAQYDKVNKQTHIAVVDTDKNRLTTVTQNEPFEAKEVILEEEPTALNIIVKGKKKGKKQPSSRTMINITDLY